MFCPTCGSQLPNDAAFCGTCGTRLNGYAAVAQIPMARPMMMPGNPMNPAVTTKPSFKKLSRVGAALLSLILLAALVFFSLTSCVGIQHKSYGSAREVASALTEAANEFLASERGQDDQMRALAAAAAMMPAGIAENYIEFLDFDSADEAVKDLSGDPSWNEVIGRAGCLEVTFKSSSSNSLSRDSVRQLQNTLEDLGLDGYVEEAIPLAAHIKVTQSMKSAGLTRGDTNTVSYTPFYAVEIDGEWFLWVNDLKYYIELLDRIEF